MKLRLAILAAILALTFALIDSAAQNKQPPKKDVIPHAQDKMPGPALSPQEALKKMQVPPGFHVELVASEPDIVNPVAMTFDERGRIWITESIEYPRRSPGPGKDRVKVLESTKGDGKFDKITTVIDGLNIPSGIAIGHGGVWLANAPDILYYPFEDFAALKLGKPQVVVTGFGRFDTHELPNSLTWGPDGWLYGLNGVFNRSVVKQDGKTFDFTCALFKIHPKTKKFEIFCEGTSNPWGLAFNDNGDAFVSACVIDHLWHLTETGYYHRQGGPYPPYTWKIGSIVNHRHQKAAYCGLCWFDSDAYPPAYREKLYMGNIHGSAINCDELARDGSTYAAKPALSLKSPTAKGVGDGSNFLVANDAWFMPVVQKVGPDGCMYILDWYDRYHCYQDANRDPAGIDRLHGRLYRVVYGDYKPAGKVDLAAAKTIDLFAKLDDPNIYVRDTAQRLLVERLRDPAPGNVVDIRARAVISQKVFDKNLSRRHRLHSLWVTSAMSQGGLAGGEYGALLKDSDPAIRAWAVRLASPNFTKDSPFRTETLALAKSSHREAQVQLAIIARKLDGLDPMPVLIDVLANCGDDKLIPHIVWQNLHPLLEKDGERFLTLASKVDLAKSPGVAKLLPRAIDRILGNASGDPAAVVAYIEKLPTGDLDKIRTGEACMNALIGKVQSRELSGKQFAEFKQKVNPLINNLTDKSKPNHPLFYSAYLLSVSMGEPDHQRFVSNMLDELDLPLNEHVRSFDALLAGRSYLLKNNVSNLLYRGDRKKSVGLRALVLTKLGVVDEPWVAKEVLTRYPTFNDDEKAKAIELLTQRPNWAKVLFYEIGAKQVSKDVVNINQARRLLATKDAELAKLVAKHWGVPRDGRNPERERIVAEMKELYRKTPGDAKAGAPIFKKLCGQCHKLHGEGVDVGPDITANGRSDFDQLLSNIFDPSLVIGAGYQAVTVNTRQGQTLSGLIVEDNAQRVVLKVQGGEIKTIARADVEEQYTSKVSLMPEDLEKQLRPQEIVDLLEYLSFDRPPTDTKARRIPGTPR